MFNINNNYNNNERTYNRILHFVAHGKRGSGNGSPVRRSEGDTVRKRERER